MDARNREAQQPDVEVPKPPTTKEDSDARGVYNDFMKAGDRLNQAAEQQRAQRAQYDRIQQNLKGPEKSAWQRGMDAVGAKMQKLVDRAMGRKDELLSMIDDPAFDVPKAFSEEDNAFFAKGDQMNEEAAQRAQYDKIQDNIKRLTPKPKAVPVDSLPKNDAFREMATDAKWNVPTTEITAEDEKFFEDGEKAA